MRRLETPRIRITDPGELIEAVPYLLGFHPFESLVVLGFRGHDEGPRRVHVALRIDLPSYPVRRGDFAELIDTLRGSDITAIAGIWLTDGGPANSAQVHSMADILSDDAVEKGIAVLDLLLASARRWWSLRCDDPRCCPPEGNQRSRDSAVSAAQATYSGLVALPDRASVEQQLDGAPGPERERLRTAVDTELGRSGVRSAGYVQEFLAVADRLSAFRTERLDDRDVARHGAALQNIGARDEIWLLIDEGSVDADALLRELHTRLPGPYDAPALFLFGWSRWREGDGTTAALAAERALSSDEGYSAAQLLLTAVRGGLYPHTTPPLRRPGR